MRRVTVIVAEVLMAPANHVRAMLGKTGRFDIHHSADWQGAGIIVAL